MAQQYIDVGNVANDGTGDPLRTAFQLINSNFNDVYNPSNIANGSSRVDVAEDGNIFITSNGIANVVSISSSAVTINGNLTVTGNATLTGNIIGDRVTNGTSEIAIQTANGNANITIGNVSNVAVFTTTGLNITGIASVSGNVLAAGLSLSGNVLSNLNSTSNITTTANIAGGNVLSTGLSLSGNVLSNLNSTSNITTTANVAATAFIGTLVAASGNISGGNVLTSGSVSVSGNIYGRDITIGSGNTGNAVIYGNLTVYGNTTTINSNTVTTNDLNITVGNNQNTGAALNNAGLDVGNNALAYWRFNNATTSWQSNVSVLPAANGIQSLGGTSNYWGTAYLTTASLTGSISSGNLTAANIETSGLISAAGNITGGNLLGTNITGTLTTAAQPNVTSVGTLTSLNSGTISSSGTVTATSLLGSVVSASANVIGGNLTTTGQVSASGNITAGSNITGGNLLTSGIVSASSFIGSVVSVTGNITAGNINGTMVGTSATITGNATIGNANIGAYTSQALRVNGSGYVTSSAIADPYAASGTFDVAGINSPNVTIRAYSQTTLSTSGPVLQFVRKQQTGSALAAGYDAGHMKFWAIQPNDDIYNYIGEIVAVTSGSGTDGQLQFYSGLANVPQLVLTLNSAKQANFASTISAAGNITGANLLTAGLASAASYVGSVVSVSSNITGGNVNSGGVVSSSGNVIGGNVSTTGTVTGGTLNSAGTISAVSTVTAGNFATAGTVSATGNIIAGNVNTGGTLSATGSVTGSSVTTSGTVSATGTVTGGNLATGGTASAAGTITGGNILTGGNVSAVGNITGSYFIGNGSQLTGPLQSNPDGDGIAAAYGDLNPLINSIQVNGTWAFGADGNVYNGALQSKVVNAYNGFVNSSNGYYVGSIDPYTSSGPLITTQVIDGNGNITAPMINTTGNISTAGNVIGVIRPTAGSGENGIVFPDNPGGGGGDTATIQYYAVTGEDSVLELRVTNDAADTIKLNASGGVSVVGTLTGGNVSVAGNVLGGNLSVSGNVIGSTNGYSIGYLNVPQVALNSNISAALADSGKHYYTTAGSNVSLTIPNNTSVSWAVGTTLVIINKGTANVIIGQDTGVSLYLAGNSTAANRALSSYGMATLINTGANVWFINGTGLS